LSYVYLILENGAVFRGQPFGYDGEAVGELVFSTAMTGYLETLSDPSYYGQIVLQTFPLIGNYGVISEDFGSGPIHLSAYIVRDWCQEPSNFRSEGNLDSFLRKNKIPGIFDIDTRKLTRIIRENGTLNAMISKSFELSEAQWKKLREHKIENAVAKAAEKSAEKSALEVSADSEGCCKDSSEASKEACVAVWDFGAAYGLNEILSNNGLCVSNVFGHKNKADDLLSTKADAIILTGGPGDPKENTELIEEIKKLCNKSDRNIPILAIGLGHQLLAIANGAKTEKLPFGHRGANQAVKEVGTSSAFVTAQNHGYFVSEALLPKGATMSYINVNDGTCEGFEYKNIPALSVQFEPTREIFKKFKKMIEGGCSNASK